MEVSDLNKIKQIDDQKEYLLEQVVFDYKIKGRKPVRLDEIVFKDVIQKQGTMFEEMMDHLEVNKLLCEITNLAKQKQQQGTQSEALIELR